MRSRIPLAVIILSSLALAQDVDDERELLDDISIEKAIETEYIVDDAVEINDIDVDVSSGIVQLSGRAESLLAKERATHIAERVKGVRAVSNRIVVAADVQRWDRYIRRDVIHALLTDPATERQNIEVGVKDGAVTLGGVVNSLAERELAMTVAKGVKGVTSVTSSLEVKPLQGREDADIHADVEQRLRWDVLLESALITVDVTDGRVELTGTVGSAAERRHAVRVARVAGVEFVDAFNLEVEPWARSSAIRTDEPTYSDSDISRAVELAMLHDPRVHSFLITPSVHDGGVTLRGAVDNAKAKRTAEDLARHTVGVRQVTNLLKVRPAVRRADRAVARDVENALDLNPYTEGAEIGVVVVQGTAILGGEVDGYFQRVEAEDVAERVSGVIRVDNLIEVRGARNYKEPWFHFPTHPAVLPLPLPPLDDDEAIERNIVDGISWNPVLDSRDVHVDVDDGVATLTGNVLTWREYRAAAEEAHAGGASRVVNRIGITW